MRELRWIAAFAYKNQTAISNSSQGLFFFCAVELNVVVLRDFQVLCFAQAIAVANLVGNAVLTFATDHINTSLTRFDELAQQSVIHFLKRSTFCFCRRDLCGIRSRSEGGGASVATAGAAQRPSEIIIAVSMRRISCSVTRP